MRWTAALTLATLVAGYATVVLGGYVSSIGAGLACPDWPTCRGQLVPNLGDPLIAAEYSHRLAALLTGVFALASLIAVWLFASAARGLVAATSAAFTLLLVQVFLGMVTVSSALEPVIVTGHLAVATAFIAAMAATVVLALRG